MVAAARKDTGQQARAHSLAAGDPLTAQTWADFVDRLRNDCVGAGVREHCTSAALFTVQKQTKTYGFERDYAEGIVVRVDEAEWPTPQKYWEDLSEAQQQYHNSASQTLFDKNFLELSEEDQWDYLAGLPDHMVTGWNSNWEFVNCHFTDDAANAFIRRKKHDYGRLRVYVESQFFAWEFEAIKEAILCGRLQLVELNS